MIYLYVKTHNLTGLKYFGKTVKKDPHKYTGSGTYWKKHLKKHGFNYSTEIVATFEDESLCESFALKFSSDHDIVNSPLWANLQAENGLHGAPKGHAGHKFTPEQLQKISETSKQRWADPEQRKKLLESQTNSWTEHRKYQQVERLTGKKRPEHSQLMKSKPLPENFKCIDKTDEHKARIAEALRGKPKTDDHKKSLSKPKTRVCRIHDRKEMAVNAYTRWVKSLLVHEIKI
jgi:hypothetical protein